MSRGGYRPGAGRPKGSCTDKTKRKVPLLPKATREIVVAALKEAAPDLGTPLGYMLAVMTDPAADDARRDKMAIAAAPFVHPRMADNRLGKRDGEKEAASRAGGGKFASPEAPKLVVNNR